VPECRKIKNDGLDQYCRECSDVFGITGLERVNPLHKLPLLTSFTGGELLLGICPPVKKLGAAEVFGNENPVTEKYALNCMPLVKPHLTPQSA